jgi:hypothetical protein
MGSRAGSYSLTALAEFNTIKSFGPNLSEMIGPYSFDHWENLRGVMQSARLNYTTQLSIILEVSL